MYYVPLANKLNRMMHSQRVLYAQVGYQPTATIALEIGGGNGLQGMGLVCHVIEPSLLFCRSVFGRFLQYESPYS